MRYKWTPKVYPPIDAVWVVFDGLTSYIHITSHRSRMSVLQRLLSVAASGPTHADWHQAVIGTCDRWATESLLSKVMRRVTSRTQVRPQ